VKIRKTVMLTDLEGTWAELEATGGLTAEASRRRDECKTESDLTKWEMYRLPVLALAGLYKFENPVDP
jgi:hypothetical protein